MVQIASLSEVAMVIGQVSVSYLRTTDFKISWRKYFLIFANVNKEKNRGRIGIYWNEW